MNAGGAVLVIAGLWVCFQVLAGNALERLNIVQSSDPAHFGHALPKTT